MKKFAVLGSCLCGTLTMRLKEAGFEHTSSLHHMRSDALLQYIESPGSFGLPQEAVESIDKLLRAPQVQKASALKMRVTNQSHRRIDKFLDSLAETDLLVIDNQYDTRRPLYKVSIDGSDYVVSNTNLAALDIPTRSLGLMAIENAAEIYGRLFGKLRAINPGLQIVFIHYPISRFLSPEGYADPIVKRSREVVRLLDAPPTVTVVPLLHIREVSDLSTANRNHFTPRIYSLYTDAVMRLAGGQQMPCSPQEEIEVADLAEFCGRKRAEAPAAQRAPAGDNPYRDLPQRQFWKAAVGDRYPLAIDELYTRKFPILTTDAVATCGSCFAQHIGRRLGARGFNYMDVEKAPASMAPQDRTANGYGIYSARYGNVYTSRQLLQLMERALGQRHFDEAWELPAGPDGSIRYVDPFRPNLAPGGYASPEEMLQEQQRHLAAVRQLFNTLDVFVFTMGLTEHWTNRSTGAAYPISPGVSAGRFDPAVHGFHNLNYEETMKDMLSFIDRLKTVNPKARMLLTVSPVPLTATAEDRHVLVSTIHSKSILRAVAGELAQRFDFVDYFPSYEIVMSPPFRGMFFQNNMRTVHEQGVDFVMSHFFAQHQPDGAERAAEVADDELFCDEVLLEAERSAG